MTTQEWKQAEESMKGLFARIKLEVDGYNVSIVKELHRDKFNYIIYINGELCGKWFNQDDKEFLEIRQRFYREVTCRAYSYRKKEEILSGVKSKKMLAEYIEKLGLDRTYSYYQMTFNSFKSVKAKLIKNNKSIKLIEL